MSDFGAVVTAAGAIAAALISALALYQTRRTHLLINSRMDELLRLSAQAARAEGVAAGEQAQRDRSAPVEE